MARTTPIIQDGILTYQRDSQIYHLPVGSTDWYLWLETATSFAFGGLDGFTARRERASNNRGGWYWKAYARRDGKLRHAYLGKAETLTNDRFKIVASELAHDLETASPPTLSLSINTNIGMNEEQDLLHAASTSIIGREQEALTICSMLHNPNLRLLTITGPGGVGKTCLALHVVKLIEADFPDGVYRISLATISDPALVVPALAQKLNLVKTGEEPLLSRLTSFLYDKCILLLLDNFEQVIEAAPFLAEILNRCPTVKMLVTSREILRLRMSQEFVVPPLALPDLSHLPAMLQISNFAAVALFVERAQAVKNDFRLTEANAPAIVEICTRLDGLPLAIELAAARIKLLPPQLLLERLKESLQMLTRGALDLPPRQQTLRDTLAWSYDLLDQEEQRLFCQLSVFVRGCTLETIEQFSKNMQALQAQPLHPTPLLDRITSLIDKSLLQQIEQDNGDVRLMMLETLRAYGNECLDASNESMITRNAHALYYLSQAEQAAPQLRTGSQIAWLSRLDQEYDNIRTALQWFYEQEQIEEAFRLGWALWQFWVVRNRCHEAYQWMESIITLSEQKSTLEVAEILAIPAQITANASFATAMLAESQSFYQRAESLLLTSLELYHHCGDHTGIAATLNKLGQIRARQATDEAHDYFEKSLAMAKKWQDRYGIADALVSLANEASSLSELSRARVLLQESLKIYQEQEDTRSCAHCLGYLGLVAANEGNHKAAREFYKQSLALHRLVGDRVGIAFSLIPLGLVTLYDSSITISNSWSREDHNFARGIGSQGEVDHYLDTLSEIALSQKDEHDALPVAHPLLEESLAIFKTAGNEEGIASKLFSLGYVELSQGNFPVARRLLEECGEIFRTHKNSNMIAATLYSLGHIEAYTGNWATARKLMSESIQMARQTDDRLVLAVRLSHLGLVRLNEGEDTDAQTLLEESLVYARQSGDQWLVAEVLGVMALLPMTQGDFTLAQELLDESQAILSACGDRSSMVYRLADLGLLAIRQGDMQKAQPLIEKALSMSMQAGNRWFIASCLERLGEIIVEQGQFARAVLLWGCAAQMREAISAPIPPIEQDLYNHALEHARKQLGESHFQLLWQEGHAYTPPQVLAIQEQTLLLLTEPIRRAEKRESTTKLTNREREVLNLLATGLTNDQIAEQLVISARTVRTHLSSIYGKIGVVSRSAATRYAIEHHLA